MVDKFKLVGLNFEINHAQKAQDVWKSYCTLNAITPCYDRKPEILIVNPGLRSQHGVYDRKLGFTIATWNYGI